MSKHVLAALTVLAVVSSVQAGPFIIDGSRDAAYGAALAVQQTGTAFGNSNLGQADYANGSELDAGYGVLAGGNLYLLLTGNLETNFNKLDIFIDSVSGGQNKLRGDNPDIDFNGLNRMGDDGSGNGLTFDPGFEADAWISITGGGGPFNYYLNYSRLLTGGGPPGPPTAPNGFQGGSGLPGPLMGANGIQVGWNNSNTLGVSSYGNPHDSPPESVLTGFEFLIPLSLLGDPTGPVKVTAFVNGGGHDFVSNQMLGALPLGYGNMGEPRNLNLGAHAGDQFFVVPEPAAGGLLLLAALLVCRRRRSACWSA